MPDIIKSKIHYYTVLELLKNRNISYKENGNYSVSADYEGDDLPLPFTINVDQENGVLMFYSVLPFVVSNEKKMAMAILVCEINRKLPRGYFDYSQSAGTVAFKMTTSYINCDFEKEYLDEMITYCIDKTDDYNDKFLKFNKDLIDIAQIVDD